jgi:hypothetical protein
MNMIPYIVLRVIRPVDFPDCTNGGMSGQFANVQLVGVTHNGGRTVETLPRDYGFQTFAPIQPPTGYPFVAIEVREMGGPVLTIVPVVYDPATDRFAVSTPPGKVGPSSGGNYADTSDSRFHDLTKHLFGRYLYAALPIHDRFE